MGQGRAAPPGRAAPVLVQGGGDAAVEAEAVLSWARCLPSLQGIAPRPVPLCAGLAKAPKKRGRFVVSGLSWTCRDPQGAPMQPWVLDPAWC